MSGLVEMTKEQLDLIIPLLQAQKRQLQEAEPQRETRTTFSVDSMLHKKTKGQRSTPDQKYFAVSLLRIYAYACMVRLPPQINYDARCAERLPGAVESLLLTS